MKKTYRAFVLFVFIALPIIELQAAPWWASEFEVNGMKALVKYNDIKYIEDAINEFRIYQKHVTKYSDLNNNFYKDFDDIFTFKLPLKCIQPSSFFIDLEKIELFEKYVDPENVYLPVAIINEEYVLLDHHNLLYF